MSLNVSMPEERSTIVTEESCTRPNIEGVRIAATETDDLQALLSGSHSTLIQELPAEELRNSITNMVCHAFI